MTTRLWLRLAEILTPAVIAIALMAAWSADRRDRAELAAQLATAKQALEQADARQHDRDAQLLKTLSAFSAEKRAITTPAQIIRDLPQQIPLPSPVFLQPPNTAAAAATKSLPDAPRPIPDPKITAATTAVIPAEDLKPLYDFAVDCKACQAKLTASQSDLTDEREKTALLTKERDEAIRIAKGGSALRRIARAAKWLAIGAAFGALASRAAH